MLTELICTSNINFSFRKRKLTEREFSHIHNITATNKNDERRYEQNYHQEP